MYEKTKIIKQILFVILPDPVWCERVYQIMMYVSYGYQLKKSSAHRKMNNILQISVHRPKFDVCLG